MRILIGLLVGIFLAVIPLSNTTYAKAEIPKNIKPPLLFVKNNGQFDDEVAFYAKPMGLEVFITKKGEIVYSITKKEGEALKITPFKETLVSKPSLKGKDKNKAVFNYFIGNDKSKWQSNVPTYQTIELGQVSHGISLNLKVKESNIEKLFFVSPNADVKDIYIKTSGGELTINNKGELVVKTASGEITFTKPVAFQEIDGKKVDIKIAYSFQKDGYGFTVGEYDKTKPLIIDPLLASRFVGGTQGDAARAIARDSSGNIFIAGDTAGSSTFPKLNQYTCTNCDNYDCTVSKFDSNLQMLASSVIGGSSYEWCDDMIINSSNQVYLIGSSMSNNFPMTGSPYQSGLAGDRDVVIARLSNDLATLQASTYLGGSGWDKAFKGVFDYAENIYITGETSSTNFPIPPSPYVPYQSSNGGGTDAFVSKLSADLSTLQGSTYLGKTGTDYGRGISYIYGSGVYVVGSTNSSDFTTGATNPYGAYGGGYDGFIALLSADLTTLNAARFIGGDGGDYAQYIFDYGGNVFVSGYEGSTNFNYSPGKFAGPGGGDDAFLLKISVNLDTVLIAAGIGGTGNEQSMAGGMPIEQFGGSSIFLAGKTSSNDFPATSGAYSTSIAGGFDGFIAKFDSNLNLTAATFIGGSSDDDITGLVIDAAGENLFACGETSSSNFPTTHGPLYGGGFSDQFVFKMTPDLLTSSTNYTLTVTKAGSGSGTVTATGCTLNWVGNTGTCTVTANTSITLNGAADANSFFSGFTGAQCAGTALCEIVMNSNKFVTATFQPAGTGGVIHIPQTGQTATYDGNTLKRDDGAIRTGQYWPTVRFITASPTGTVIDKLSGLMWMATGNTPTVGSCTGGLMTWTAALDYVTCLNNNAYLGFSDWRLPNVNELASLFNAGVSNTATWLNSQGFSNIPTSSAWYWTSTTNTAASSSAVAVATDNGSFVSDAKTNTDYTIAVRQSSYSPVLSMIAKTGQTTNYDPARHGEDGDIQAGEPFPSPRFVDDTNTSITIDNLTGLKWLKVANTPTVGSCTGGAKTWQGAIDYINCLNANNYLGYNDWRLPNKNELRSLMFYGNANPALQTGHPFTNVQNSTYWTSTTVSSSTTSAYTVNFSTGLLSNVSKTNSTPYVLPVRGGLISINVSVSGGGLVKDLDDKINCPSTCSATYTYCSDDYIILSFIPNTGKTLNSVIVNGMSLGAVHSLKIRSATHYVDVVAVFSP